MNRKQREMDGVLERRAIRNFWKINKKTLKKNIRMKKAKYHLDFLFIKTAYETIKKTVCVKQGCHLKPGQICE
jgi:hypothetical protein